ncbi:MAG: PHP domain-containing protein, partial [Methanomicrobiales archaeon]|nr:PHP domain-containing protein [Methanomicrobiales archaeon]
IHGQDGLSLVPHPFCNHRGSVLSPVARNALAERIDLIEGHNARNLSDSDDRLAVVFACDLGIPFTAGSDAHLAMELGRVWMRVPPFDGPKELLKGLAGAPFTFRRMNRAVHFVSSLIKRVKGSRD